MNIRIKFATAFLTGISAGGLFSIVTNGGTIKQIALLCVIGLLSLFIRTLDSMKQTDNDRN